MKILLATLSDAPSMAELFLAHIQAHRFFQKRGFAQVSAIFKLV